MRVAAGNAKRAGQHPRAGYLHGAGIRTANQLHGTLERDPGFFRGGFQPIHDPWF